MAKESIRNRIAFERRTTWVKEGTFKRGKIQIVRGGDSVSRKGSIGIRKDTEGSCKGQG
jgi:hypothetical protein